VTNDNKLTAFITFTFASYCLITGICRHFQSFWVSVPANKHRIEAFFSIGTFHFYEVRMQEKKGRKGI